MGLFRLFKRKLTPEQKEKKKAAIVDKMVRLVAKYNNTDNEFRRWHCNSFFEGYETAAQNKVKLQRMQASTEDATQKTLRAIEQTDKAYLSDVAIDFYERHVRREDRIWKEAKCVQ